MAQAQPRQIVAISHRGEHLHHPENTLPAFQAAIDAGADYFELDVRTTSDGKLVLSHDGVGCPPHQWQGRYREDDVRRSPRAGCRDQVRA